LTRTGLAQIGSLSLAERENVPAERGIIIAVHGFHDHSRSLAAADILRDSRGITP
jgi:hypothetical protein